MSEIRNPPPNVWWHCYACGQSNGPRDTEFCSLCGRRKEHVIDRERWEKFFDAYKARLVEGVEGMNCGCVEALALGPDENFHRVHDYDCPVAAVLRLIEETPACRKEY